MRIGNMKMPMEKQKLVVMEEEIYAGVPGMEVIEVKSCSGH
jgi:hypothetical protein